MSDVRNDMRDHACLEHADAADLDRYLRFLRLFDPRPAEADDGRDGPPPTSGCEAIGEATDRPASADEGSTFRDLFLRQGMCEWALLRTMGWADELTVESAGVVRGYHIREAQHRDGCLILREADPDGVVFIKGFADPDRGLVSLEGWIRARDGKRDAWRRDLGDEHGAVFFVPQSALRPMQTLPHDPEPFPAPQRIIVSADDPWTVEVVVADAQGEI